MAIAGAIVAVAGTAYSIDQSNKAAKKQERAQEIQQSQQISEQRTANQRAERERRIRAARLRQSAENTGTSTSSGVFGAIGGAQTDLASGLAFGSQRIATAGNVGEQLASARTNQANASIGQGAASLGMSVFSSQGGFSNIFSGGG
ncbi:MAG: hypothetical protein AAFN81_08305 [Bacteroidota bacterium]